MAELFALIAGRRGIGDLLARGIEEASGQLGLADLAIHVKGLEPAGFEPRVLTGMGLSYATAARGACHLRGAFYKAELSGQIAKGPIDGKAELHIDYEDRAALFDCLILCRFYRDLIQWEELALIFEAAMGLSLTKEELELSANAVTQRTRSYNRREGLPEASDTLPERFFTEPAAEGARLDRAGFESMLRRYNEIRRMRNEKAKAGR